LNVDGVGTLSPISVEMIRGLPVSGLGFDPTVSLLTEWVTQRSETHFFACVNAHSAEVAHRDAKFMEVLRAAHLLVPDGAGVVLASRVLGGRIRERVTGPDLFMAVSRRLNEVGGRSVFYLGGTPETLKRISLRHRAEFPHLAIAGMFSPPYRLNFSAEEVAAMAERVKAAAPDVLWVGVGAPKQEKLVFDLRSAIDVPLCGPVGAMFDYFAGNVAMPPKWVERFGLHWLHRLLSNPRRMWRRNLDSPVFLGHVAAERLGRMFGNHTP
jgi:N-acetylglucosaminyldiphosphoundecaprenol N-acetyl-beta-D-mannosaminyltransferase